MFIYQLIIRNEETIIEKLKKLVGKEVLLGLANVATLQPHYYMGKLIEVSEDWIQVDVEIGRFKKHTDHVHLNRKAFLISYITEVIK